MVGRRVGGGRGPPGRHSPGVYTVKFAGWVYVLHCFQKKSQSGIATPKPD
ncbi:type II toxin-antitoxin system RelE/ParE family toxin [Legionella pneumophila]|nr:type II toxin-antitoxin system RelE/ParE family toxin [Legionella pneumophila]